MDPKKFSILEGIEVKGGIVGVLGGGCQYYIKGGGELGVCDLREKETKQRVVPKK